MSRNSVGSTMRYRGRSTLLVSTQVHPHPMLRCNVTYSIGSYVSPDERNESAVPRLRLNWNNYALYAVRAAAIHWTLAFISALISLCWAAQKMHGHGI